MAKELTFGYSPCPNDTYMFNAIAHGAVGVDGYRLQPTLHDIETLNGMAMDAVLDVTKLSFYAWLEVKDRYQLLDSGAAMGFGCGPVLIARKQLTQAEIHRCRVVLPGRWTTAHLLLRLWAPDADQRFFTPYDRIFDALASGQADCGVITITALSRLTGWNRTMPAIGPVASLPKIRSSSPIITSGVTCSSGNRPIDMPASQSTSKLWMVSSR